MEDQEAYSRAERRVEEKMGFITHLAAFIVVNTGLFFVNMFTSPDYFWFVWPLIGWGIGLVFHGLNVFMFTAGSSLRERMIQKELEKEQKHRQP
ncbi:MAG: 2TM domain-containing protein [Spirochaetota bacterium]